MRKELRVENRELRKGQLHPVVPTLPLVLSSDVGIGRLTNGIIWNDQIDLAESQLWINEKLAEQAE